MNIKAGPIFGWNYKCDKRIVINQGGSSSGKTYGINQVLLTKLGEGPGNEVCTITAETFPTLRLGAMRDLNNIISDPNQPFRYYIKNIDKSTSTYTLFNNSQIEFRAYPDVESAVHGRREYLFMNEANHLSYLVAQQLMMRTKKQIYIDFNPTSDFWAHSEFMADPRAQWFFSTYRNNPFVQQAIVEEIERYKLTSPEMYKIYGLGKRGNLSGQVFSNITWIDKFPEYVKDRTYGMDVGFSNSFTTLTELGLFNGKMHGRELLYERGLTDNDIVAKYRDLGISTTVPLVVDSANQATIEELSRAGFNAYGCAKKDVTREIQQMLGYDWCITNDSVNWKKEARNYIYQQDKKSGDFLNVPIKNFDHLWDAARYAFLDMVGGSDLPAFK